MNVITIEDWAIVSVSDTNSITTSRHLLGLVMSDNSVEYRQYEYICTSNLASIDFVDLEVTTVSGGTYSLQGEGSDFIVDSEEFEQLKSGSCPFGIDLNRMLDEYDGK